MESIVPVILESLKSGFGISALAVLLWPVIGLLALKMLQAPWMVSLLGRSLSWARGVGVGMAMMPKSGVMRALFSPFVYLGVYVIAVAMALLDGILNQCDPETQKLANNLIAALRKAGAKDHLAYLEQKVASVSVCEPDAGHREVAETSKSD